MTVSPQKAPDKIENVKIGFEAGVPVSVNGKRLGAFEVVSLLNQIGGRNGVGQIDMVENRFVGMKSRGVYEAPGMTLLYAAHRVVEQLTLDRDLMHLRDRLAPEVAEMVYYGFWYHAKLDALMAFIREAQKPVTGEVSLNLYKGNIIVDGRSSPEQPLRRGHRHDGRRRLVQPDRRRGFSAHPRSARPRAGAGVAAEVLSSGAEDEAPHGVKLGTAVGHVSNCRVGLCNLLSPTIDCKTSSGRHGIALR